MEAPTAREVGGESVWKMLESERGAKTEMGTAAGRGMGWRVSASS